MWGIFVQQVGLLWIILVCLSAAGLIALATILYLNQRKLALSNRKKLIELSQSIGGLEGCRIENLEPVSDFVGDMMNPEFQSAFTCLAEDSRDIFKMVWIPDPQTRLPLPGILPPAVRAVLRKSSGLAIFLGGLAVSVIALTTGYVLSGKMLDAPLLRLMAVMPLMVAVLGMLALFYMGGQHYQEIKRAWQELMISLDRRLPVYTQAAETAALINQMKEYDNRMSASVLVLSDKVQSLASGKLTDAVSNAVKYVMAATVAPAVIRSTESLTTLAGEMEKQMKGMDQAVVRLYSEMDARQQKQAELWLKRYQEISEVLTDQQGSFLNTMSTSQQQLIDDLGRSQTFALERIVDEQKQTLQHMNGVAQKSWTILQEKLTLIINQLADGQNRLLTGLTEQQQQTLTTISKTSAETGESLQKQYQTSLDQLQKTQTEIWQQQNENQKMAYDSLLVSQKESFTALADQQQKLQQQTEKLQQEGLRQMRDNQAAALKQLTENQATILKEIDQRQAEALLTISSQQATALQTISSQQAQALQEMNTVQNQTLNGITRTQENNLTSMAKRQQEALQQLADRFSSEVSGTLASYLEPVTTRLQESANALIAAQDYARDVKDVLKLQNDQATSLQESIRDLFTQLIDTRKAMTEDLQSMKTSSSVMSRAADSMSSVYAGSQSGLSEAISQMSNDLLHLSDVLSSVMSTSAEQTRLIQSQSMETFEINQKHLDAVRGQIIILSDELSTRIEQLMIGFTGLTEDLVKNIDKTINIQNDTLGGSLTSLTEIMGNEARSMSLFAQQINMDIDSLNETLKSAVSNFDSGMRQELSTILGQFDDEISNVVRRLAHAAIELGDSVEALPQAIRLAKADKTESLPDLSLGTN
jgi:hypothetical protein